MAEQQHMCATVPLAFDLYVPEDGQNTTGDKAPIILTHGLYLNRTLYRSLGKELRSKTGRAVYNVDLRNHGDSPYPKETGVVEMAEDLFAFLQEKQLKRVVFICHSFSSKVAAILAITQPTIVVEKMILIDFAPYWSDLLWVTAERRMSDGYDHFFSKLPSQVPLELAEKLIIKYVCGSKVDYDLREMEACITVKKGDRYDAFCDRKTTHEATLKGKFGYKCKTVFHGPVMFVKEPNSMFWNTDTIAFHTKYFPNHEFVTIPNTSHLLPFEKPKEFVAEVERFLRSD